MDQPGVKVRTIENMSGDHEVNQVFFDDVLASPDNLVGEEGQGWTIAKFLLQNERGGGCYAPKLIADLQSIYVRACTTKNGDQGMMKCVQPPFYVPV